MVKWAAHGRKRGRISTVVFTRIYRKQFGATGEQPTYRGIDQGLIPRPGWRRIGRSVAGKNGGVYATVRRKSRPTQKREGFGNSRRCSVVRCCAPAKPRLCCAPRRRRVSRGRT